MILFVGGFVELEYIQNEVRKEFSLVKFVVFLEVGLIVFKGVVIFGYCFIMIMLRILCFIYGIDIILVFDFKIYREDKKIMIVGVERCKDYFFVIFFVGIEVKIGQKIIEFYLLVLIF